MSALHNNVYFTIWWKEPHVIFVSDGILSRVRLIFVYYFSINFGMKEAIWILFLKIWSHQRLIRTVVPIQYSLSLKILWLALLVNINFLWTLTQLWLCLLVKFFCQLFLSFHKTPLFKRETTCLLAYYVNSYNKIA